MVYSSGFRVKVSGSVVWGLGLKQRLQGIGVKVEGSGLRVQGLGFRP
jgi:hypothetical protein